MNINATVNVYVGIRHPDVENLVNGRLCADISNETQKGRGNYIDIY